MLLHQSLLAGTLIPLAGFVVSIVVWQVKKDVLPGIDGHGKVVINWMISELLYGVLGLLLMVVLVGIPML